MILNSLFLFKIAVILLVRMWVEMQILSQMEYMRTRHPPREDVSWNICYSWVWDTGRQSSSSWGCELKYYCFYQHFISNCHPPREDVSWNMLLDSDYKNWLCHPPREDVSWNTKSHNRNLFGILSSSSWGCELKYISQVIHNINSPSIMVS